MIAQDMNYRQWQKRNTEHFNRLDKLQQAESRRQGYRNVGWDSVKISWQLLEQATNKANPKIVSIQKNRKPPSDQTSDVTSLFDRKLQKGDILGAIDQSILESEQASEIAKQGLKKLKQNREYLNKITKDALEKYQPI